MSILEDEFDLEDHFHYQERYRYYRLLKGYLSDKLSRGEFVRGFNEIYKERYKIIYSMRRDSEEFKSLNFTSKSKDFERLISAIWYEIYEADTFDDWSKDSNLDYEEIVRRRNISVRKSLKRISEEMEAYLES